MTFSLADVDASAAALREFNGVDLAGLPRAELLRLQRLAAEGRRAWDVALASIAGEIARRSSADDGPSGLARQQGFASPEQLVASMVGVPVSDGRRLVAAGRTLSADASTPERERHPAVAEALREGEITVAMAELITTTCEALTGDVTQLEATLVQIARTHDFARLRLACRTHAARHDAVQLADRERRQHEARFIDVTQDLDGTVRFTGQLGPAGGIALLTFLDAQVKAAFQARRTGPDGNSAADATSADSRIADNRTARQIRADALAALATHGLDCESPASGVKATIIVRIDRDDLERDVGIATCDAIATPISLDLLRQVAVDASVLPMIMNGKSEVLNQGREQRLFTWAQRMALAQRDQGCVKCHAPISHCITHHIQWWSRDGRTDLRNGVLLCTRCHTQIHHDHWDIHVDHNNQVWLTPPAEIDPTRQRQPAGPAALTP